MLLTMHILVATLGIFILGFFGAPLFLWTIFSAFVMLGAGKIIWIIYLALTIIFNIIQLRRVLVSKKIMHFMKKQITKGSLHTPAFTSEEINALEKDDLLRFDEVFWEHISDTVHKFFRSTTLSIFKAALRRKS